MNGRRRKAGIVPADINYPDMPYLRLLAFMVEFMLENRGSAAILTSCVTQGCSDDDEK